MNFDEKFTIVVYTWEGGTLTTILESEESPNMG